MSLPLDEQRERPLTLVPEIQNHLSRFIRDKGSPIAAVVIADVKTGRILALTQGRSPERWGGQTHTALHAGFPAASLFKTTVTAAAFEFADVNSSAPIGLVGGCSHVHPTGMWMREDKRQGPNAMTLKRAYGHSCNGFFAKLAINRVGLGPILTMARRLGWDAVPPHLADFKVPPSPLHPPNAETSSAYTVGRFAAGFGSVGLSPVHAIWQSLIVANDGVAYPLSIFVDTPSPQESGPSLRVMTPETALKIRQVMDATVLGGTASGTFRNPRYARLRRGFGGKTGTLTGTNPEGLTTWFTGIYPLDHPEVVVSSVVILEDLWLIKATTLAAEAVAAYFDYKHSGDPITTAQVGPKRKFSRLNR
jgi:cell division protein FtsI/penicillin-binding protein 2